jgi:hypothetical protein
VVSFFLIQPASDTGHQGLQFVLFQFQQKLQIRLCLKQFPENFYESFLRHPVRPPFLFEMPPRSVLVMPLMAATSPDPVLSLFCGDPRAPPYPGKGPR